MQHITHKTAQPDTPCIVHRPCPLPFEPIMATSACDRTVTYAPFAVVRRPRVHEIVPTPYIRARSVAERVGDVIRQECAGVAWGHFGGVLEDLDVPEYDDDDCGCPEPSDPHRVWRLP